MSKPIRIRVRPVRRAEIDITKLAHALLLLARERAEATARPLPAEQPPEEHPDAA